MVFLKSSNSFSIKNHPFIINVELPGPQEIRKRARMRLSKAYHEFLLLNTVIGTHVSTRLNRYRGSYPCSSKFHKSLTQNIKVLLASEFIKGRNLLKLD